MISIYQVYFNDETKKYVEEDFLPYHNLAKDGYFENTVIRKIYEQNLDLHADNSYIGITSWQQQLKTNLTAKDIISHIEKDVEREINKDVYIYTPIPVNHCIIDGQRKAPEGYDLNGIIRAQDIWTRHETRSFVPEMDKMLNNSKVLPFDIYDGKWCYSWCNFWIVKKDVFIDYCKNILIPTIDFFERPEIKKNSPICYEHYHEKKKYSNYSFTLEGLFGSFLAHRNYSYSYIHKKQFPRHQLKKINILQYQHI